MLPTDVGPGQLQLLILLYVGPDVFLPLTSALAALGGIVLMFWHRLVGIVRRLFRRNGETPHASTTPKSKSGEA